MDYHYAGRCVSKNHKGRVRGLQGVGLGPWDNPHKVLETAVVPLEPEVVEVEGISGYFEEAPSREKY